MALYRIFERERSKIVIWRMEEGVEELYAQVQLSDSLKAEISSITNETRQKERLTALLVLQMIFGKSVEIAYTQLGAPLLVGSNFNLSISHTKGWLAIQLTSSYTPGIDLEYPSDRVIKVVHKFISLNEAFALEGDEAQKINYANLVWCAKEVLYKIAQIQGLSFLSEMKIKPFQLSKTGIIEGVVESNAMASQYTLEYWVEDEWFLVYRIG